MLYEIIWEGLSYEKTILLIMMLIMLFTISACTYELSNNLIATYDFEDRQCDITNISNATDYEKLKVTIILEAKDNFSKEIVCDIGSLKSGEIYTDDLSYFSEDIEVSNVYIKSYEYYENDILKFFALAVLVIVLIAIGVIFTNPQKHRN